MATYQERIRNKANRTVEEKVEDMPDFMQLYLESLGDHSPLTKKYYIEDIDRLIRHVMKQNSVTAEKDVTVSMLSSLTTEEISRYLDSMAVSSGFRSRNLASIKSFYRFLKNNGFCRENPAKPLKNQMTPRQKKVEVSKVDVQRLLTGVQKNDLFRAKVNGKYMILPIPEVARAKREKQILRNCAIIAMLAETDMKVSELASLNLDSLQEDGIHYQKVTGEDAVAPYTPLIKTELDKYLHGLPVPDEFARSEREVTFEKMWEFASRHMLTRRDSIRKAAEEEFGISDDKFLSDMEQVFHYERLSGRKAFIPPEKEKALFVANKLGKYKDGKGNVCPGERMSIRAIEDIVQELTETYLPDKTEITNVTPSGLKG